MKMKAKQHFLFEGNLIKIGEEFSTTENKAYVYERNNLAEKVNDKSVKPESNQTIVADETQNQDVLLNKTVPELRKIAKAEGIENVSSLKKEELITELKSKEES
jgi:hypothetical protein